MIRKYNRQLLLEKIGGFVVNRKKEQLDKLSQIKQCAKVEEKNLHENEISKVECIRFY